MNLPTPISEAVIRDASESFARISDIGGKLLWWLHKPHASERWFQFEWAYCLSDVLKDSYDVRCEADRWTDIVCHPKLRASVDTQPDRKTKCSRPSVAAGIELKWYGNWCINPSNVEKAKRDFLKIERNKFPTAALLFFLSIDANPMPTEYEWVKASAHYCRDVESLLANFTERPSLDVNVQIPVSNTSPSLSCHILGWYNHAASSGQAKPHAPEGRDDGKPASRS